MLSIFPELLTFSFFAPLLLRLVLGASFLGRGWTLKQSPLGWIFLAGGTLLIIGLFTQPAALVLAIITILHIAKRGLSTQRALTLAVLLSLLLLGPGALAFDLPL